MARIVKQTISAQASAELDAQVRETVEGILADIQSRGDQAVREYSLKFDKWSPPSFRLSAEQIQAIVDSVDPATLRSEEHTSELQSLMRISYAVFCLKKKKHTTQTTTNTNNKPQTNNT